MVPGWAGNGGIPHMGVAVAKAGAIQDRVRFAVLQRSKPVLPAHGLATATVNPEWETKNAHRHMYIDYIRSSRASRLKLKRDHYFQNDGVMVDLRHLVKHDDLSHIDPENGLAPPEPDDCLFLIKPYRADGESGSVESIATAKKVMMSKLLQKQLSSQLVESDQRKLQMQFEKLSEPVVHRPKPAGGFDLFAKLPMPATPPPIVPPEAALTATDLANVYAAVSEIDLGDITIHSTTRVPLNFLNATPSKVPVHLSIQLHEKRADGPERKFHLGVTPSQQVIPTMTVLGFEVSYCNHVLGKFEGRLTYIINGRYRYQIPIHANVIPVALELSQSRMDLEVDISASTRFGPVRDDDVERPGTAQSDMVLGHSHTEYSGQAELHSHSQGQGHGQHDHGGEGRKLSQDLPVAEKYVTVYNNGMSDAMFEWIDNASSGTTGAGTGGQHVHNKHEKHHHNLFFSSLDHIEGRISIEPRQAIVPSKSYMRLKVTYTPGLKPTFDRTVVLNVIDCYNNERVIAGRMELACHGEISAANCVLLTSTKQGPLDLGIIPISLSETNSRAPSVVSGVSSSHAGRGGADGCASSVPGGSNPTPVSNSTMNTSIVSPAPTSVGGPVSIAQAIAGTAGGNGSAAPSSSSAARIQFLNTVFTHAQTSISKVYSGKTAPKGSRTIKIKNASLTACLFMASIVSKTPEVQITPQMGMIAGGGNGVLELQVTASPTRVGVFDDMVIVSIVGGAKTFRIPIQYEGREADIQFSVLGGEMGGGAIIGSQSCQRFQLSNHAWVYGRAVMDLREHPEFSLRVVGLVDLQQQLQQQFQQQQQMGGLDQSQVPPSHLHDKSASALHHHHTIANVASTNGGGGLASRPKTQSTIPSARSRKLDSRSNPIEATNASTRMKVIRPHHELYNIDKEARSKGGFCYVLDCMPMEGVVFELIFQPRAAAKHVLDIPVHILGMSHSEYCMQIDTEGLPSPVVLSKTGVSFKNKVVYRSVGSTAVSHLSPVSKETLTFTNTMHGPMNWRVEMPQPEYGGDVFSLEPTQSLIVTFQPDRPGIFETNATLSISYFDLHADFGISVQGSSVEPSLAFDPPEVFMPIVPLGEETMAIFSIINYGCERTEVKPVIPPDTENLEGSIELFFPEGKLLKSEGERLTVVVRFVPNAVKTPTGKLNPSVSFTTRIQFGESAKRQFFLPVHCTTDCSPLTLQPYLWMTRRECVYELRDRQGVFYERNTLLPKVDENQRRLRILNGPRPFKSPTGIPLDGSIPLQDIEHFWTRIGDTLMPWFDDHLGSTVTWKSFPSAFIASNGRLLIDFIQSLACKKINGISTSLGLVSQADEHAKHVLRQYADILTHLASIGALLSSVKPEFLLSLDDYKRITHKKFEAMKSEVGTSMHDQFLEYTTRIESNFAVISKEAWATVVLQILRVYVMPIATVRHFKHLPGVNKDEADLEWPAAKTNVYSTHENILLKWCGYHLWKRTGIKRRIKSFTDLNDSVLLANLLLSHIPSLKDSHFANFHTNPSTNDQRTFNAASLIKAFKDIYGSNYISTLAPEQLCADNQIEMIMVLVFLYQTLPHFLPVTTVEFCGALHEKVTQTIELTNPSNRPLTYTAELIGHPEYTLAESTFLLPPKSSIQVPVAFVSRFSRPVSAILRLKTKKMGINVSSILVFSLVSVVEAAAPSKVIRVDAPMYSLPPAQINVDVSNPFSRRGTFTIQLRQKRKLNPGGSEEKNLSKQTESFSPPAFRISQEEITIEPGQTSTLTVNFLPFDFGQHECILYFYDDQVGEFMYKIDGKATIPQAIDKFVWTCQSSSSLDKPLRIMPTNPHRDKAIHASLSSSAFQRATTAGANPSSNAAANATNSNKKSKDLKLSSISAMEREAYQLPRKPLRYKVEYSSPFFRGPAEIVVKPAVEGRDKTLMIEQSCTELPISFNPKLPGKYMCKVMLNCIDASDVRVYAIHGNARADGSKAELEFQIPARQSIVQDIPIINRTDEDWTIKATLQGQFFSCPYSMTAKAQSVTHYPIVFKPTKACEVSGLLSLANMQTTQRYTYFLRGCGQEPLPEDTCEVECQARDIVQETFVVRNVSDDDADFGVETDLPFVQSSLAKPIRVSAGGTAECVIKFQPKVSGSSTKCVKFVNRTDGSFVWYTVQLKVHRPPPQQVIPVASAVRKAVSVDIGLANPLQKSVEYRVFIEGKALQGEGLVRLGALEETVYSLVYAPLIQAKETGRIGFVCDEVGEFWYELKLEASDSPPIDLPDMSCPIGKCCSQPLSLENPLEQPITLSISISNARDFQIVLSPTALSSHPPPRQQTPVTKLSLRPLESTQVQLVFWPSSLTEVRKTKIEVTNPQLGNTVFQAKGTGLLPEPMETTQIVSQLNQTVSGLLVFTNPLIDPIPVAVSMQQSPTDSPSSPASGGNFTLLMNRRTRLNIAGLEKLEIPYTYTPTSMCKAEASVMVEMNAQLKWIFPIRGVPERILSSQPQVLDCRSREILERDLSLRLDGFGIDDAMASIHGTDLAHASLFSLDLEPGSGAGPDDLDVSKVLRVAVRECQSLPDGQGIQVGLSVVYSPTRPLDVHVQLVFTHMASGGRWRFPVRLVAQPPSIDDIIVIEGSINKLSMVSFTLHNGSPREKNEFTVTPQRGYLVPDAIKKETDNVFVVGYKPLSYGKTLVGTLIVEGEGISSSYEVRGVPPFYQQPVGQRFGASLNSSGSRQMLRSAVIPTKALPPAAQTSAPAVPRGKRNYVLENALPVLPSLTSSTAAATANAAV
ncbi:hypothetical protein BC831DRAFT_443384 [Entophlyctis helioformis]|nr:hypothetical protein BC831DRAFT_443384 [Entophlyctis helioformis]